MSHHDHHSAHSDGGVQHTRKLRLTLSLLLTMAFVGLEAFMGFKANSLALLTDAVHNLTDAVAIIFSLLALYWAGKPSHSRKTFGYHRAGILVALVNSLVLMFISAGVIYESLHRLNGVQSVDADPIIWVSLVALLVNGLCAWLVSHGSQHDLNLRSTFLHFLSDVLAAIGAFAAGIGIRYTGKMWLDPVAAILISGLILRSACAIVRESLDILMEATPGDLDLDQLVDVISSREGVVNVHHLHVWSLSRQLRFLSAHVLIEDMSSRQAEHLREGIAELLKSDFHIGHATLQIEFEPASCHMTLYGVPEFKGVNRSPHGHGSDHKA